MSQGLECCQADTLGNIVTPAGTGTFASASVVLVDFALQSTYSSTNSAGFNIPITLTLYSVGPNDGNGIRRVVHRDRDPKHTGALAASERPQRNDLSGNL